MTDAGEPRATPKAGKKATSKKTPSKKAATKKTPPKAASKKTAAAKGSSTKSAAKAPPTTRPTTEPMRDAADVVRAAAQIIKVFDAQPDLFLAACANPVRALRDAGVELSPEAERYVALRCRFDPERATRLEQLAAQVGEYLGDVDLDDDRAVAAALRRVDIPVELEAEGEATPAVSLSAAPSEQRPPSRRTRELHPNRRSVLAAAATLPQVHRWRQTSRGPDPFERHADKHPVFGPLLEYRRLSASVPRFASGEVYQRLARTKGGQLSDGINITLRVRLNTTAEDEDR
ncbi:hypothetical protein [Desertimonas flava]|uniref:hypothetical protein n=1 Tax=Desertimonas flava TaxID=2064846 RepID=UPI000E3486BD|nr:hypothetical protein [Desertimonas flava]